MELGQISAAHIIFIPATMLVGLVIGWILGCRAATVAMTMSARAFIAALCRLRARLCRRVRLRRSEGG